MNLTEMLDAADARRAQGAWMPAAGGTEQPFYTRTGHRVQYVYQASTGRHAYLDMGRDIIMTDKEAQAIGL